METDFDGNKIVSINTSEQKMAREKSNRAVSGKEGLKNVYK